MDNNKDTRFKIGDIVICIKPNSFNTLYEVIEVKGRIKIKSEVQEFIMVPSMFRLATENEIKKKQLKQIFYKKP